MRIQGLGPGLDAILTLHLTLRHSDTDVSVADVSRWVGGWGELMVQGLNGRDFMAAMLFSIRQNRALSVWWAGVVKLVSEVLQGGPVPCHCCRPLA